MRVEQAAQAVEIYQAAVIRLDAHHIRQRLQPGRVIGVVLHVADEHDGPVLQRQANELSQPFRDLQTQDALEFVDRGRHPEPRGQNKILRAGVNVSLDDRMGPLVGLGHPRAGDAGLRMRVAHERPERPGQPLLDRGVKPAAGGPIRVDNASLAVRCPKCLIDADDVAAKRLEVVLVSRHTSCSTNVAAYARARVRPGRLGRGRAATTGNISDLRPVPHDQPQVSASTSSPSFLLAAQRAKPCAHLLACQLASPEPKGQSRSHRHRPEQ